MRGAEDPLERVGQGRLRQQLEDLAALVDGRRAVVFADEGEATRGSSSTAPNHRLQGDTDEAMADRCPA